MIDKPSSAPEVALAYYEAWTSKDFERAMTYTSEDIICEEPVKDGKITHSRFVFDRVPFQAVPEAAT